MTPADNKKKVYVASPLGFTEAGRRHNDDVVVPALVAAGFEVLDPWELDAGLLESFAATMALPPGEGRHAAFAALNERIGRDNADDIRAADGLLAILDGTDVDSGTAAEIGFAFALGKPVVGLRLDLRTTGDNEAAVVNLQVEYFVRASGGTVAFTLDDGIRELRQLVPGEHPEPFVVA